MANDEHVAMLKQGVESWNAWREKNPDLRPDLRGADLRGEDLWQVVIQANLMRAHLSGANLSEANLRATSLVDADLTAADLTGCRIYGVSAWGLKLERSKQQNLVITPYPEPISPTITVDNIEVAQFIYLMLHNQKVRDVIDTITSKAVLILGRFTDERKAVLDALREELRKRNYLPILFDFEVPATRDITETVSLLARMARLVAADITDARSIPQELAMIAPTCRPSRCSRCCWRAALNTACSSISNGTLGSWRPTDMLRRSV